MTVSQMTQKHETGDAYALQLLPVTPNTARGNVVVHFDL
jgi:hypothetical protein